MAQRSDLQPVDHRPAVSVGSPAAWLSDVLHRIPTCTQANLTELLPWNWKPQATSPLS
ncbi:MAG: C-terminal element [Verrucomicrobiota bacterium]|jgi:hypothetical protein